MVAAVTIASALMELMMWQVTGHHWLCQNNQMLRRLIEMRNPWIDPINTMQVGSECLDTAHASIL